MISEKLKMLRERKGLKQNELADILNIQQGSYSNYERGKRTPDIEALKKIAKYYKVSADYLIDNDNKNESMITKIERELPEAEKEKLNAIIKAMYPEVYNKIKDAE